MFPLDPSPTLEELARLGDEVYERRVKPRLQPDDHGKYVAVDVKTGDFEVDEDDYSAVMRLRTRSSEAEIWLARVGYPATCRMPSVRVI